VSGLLSIWCALVLAEGGAIETQFVQVHPSLPAVASWKRSTGQSCAVVLIHGLNPHMFRDNQVSRASLRDWQQPTSTLVKTLGKVADVYAFAYGQSVPVDRIAGVPALRAGIAQLRHMGYTDIVLVGHSAGGVVARQFVEDYPGASVTKVIQVCTPNAGSSWGKAKIVVRHSQEVFLESLSPETRQVYTRERAAKQIPDWIQFICLVGNGASSGDGVVSCRSQWSEELQRQGVPAIPLATTHFRVMRSREGAERIAELVQERQFRWDAAKVGAARHKLLGGAEHRTEAVH
jgi:pimeloyl-ACP methyl ester carboxylesterase